MTECKRYYSKDYGEEFYIFDSQTLTEDEFDEQIEFEGYSVFADSLTQQEIVDLLNEKEQLKKDVEYWKQVASQYSNELNVFEHCKKYKTKCNDIYWSSDVDG